MLLNLVILVYLSNSAFSFADKLKRTAVTYACIDGAANVLSYLLSRGSNPNNTDTSGI